MSDDKTFRLDPCWIHFTAAQGGFSLPLMEFATTLADVCQQLTEAGREPEYLLATVRQMIRSRYHVVVTLDEARGVFARLMSLRSEWLAQAAADLAALEALRPPKPPEYLRGLRQPVSGAAELN
jgi:hypothetical protein